MRMWQVALVVALGNWLPCLLAFGIMPAWRKRAVVAVVLFVTGILATALGNPWVWGRNTPGPGCGIRCNWACWGWAADCGQPGVAPQVVCMAGGGSPGGAIVPGQRRGRVGLFRPGAWKEWLPGRFIPLLQGSPNG